MGLKETCAPRAPGSINPQQPTRGNNRKANGKAKKGAAPVPQGSEGWGAMPWSRSRQTSLVRDQIINISGLASVRSVAITHLRGREKTSTGQVNKWAWPCANKTLIMDSDIHISCNFTCHKILLCFPFFQPPKKPQKPSSADGRTRTGRGPTPRQPPGCAGRATREEAQECALSPVLCACSSPSCCRVFKNLTGTGGMEPVKQRE